MNPEIKIIYRVAINYDIKTQYIRVNRFRLENPKWINKNPGENEAYFIVKKHKKF